MCSTDTAVGKTGWKQQKKMPPHGVGYTEQPPRCCLAAEVMLSRPRSATPTIHDQIMRDRHRVMTQGELQRPRSTAAGRGSPYWQSASTPGCTKRQNETRHNRSLSSEQYAASSTVTQTRMTKLSDATDEIQSSGVLGSRRYRHSADRERGRGRNLRRETGPRTVPPPVQLSRSPSPTLARKCRRQEDAKDRGRPPTYATQYKKRSGGSGHSSPTADLRMRPCIKYRAAEQQLTTCAGTSPCYHEILSETEPALVDEQPLADSDQLPPLSDQELYFDSLEENEPSRGHHDRRTTTDLEKQTPASMPAQTATEDQVAVESMASTADTLPQQPSKPEMVATTSSVETSEGKAMTENVPAKESGKESSETTEKPEVVPGENGDSSPGIVAVASVPDDIAVNDLTDNQLAEISADDTTDTSESKDVTTQTIILDEVSGGVAADGIVKQPEPETETPRQRLLGPDSENDTSRFLLHENGVATMTYVARIPEAVSCWTIAVSLSPSNWTPSEDCQLVHVAQLLLGQLQTAIDHLTLQPETFNDHPLLPVVDELDEDKMELEELEVAKSVDCPIAAASDVTLTSNVDTEQLPVEPETAELGFPEVDLVSAPNAADVGGDLTVSGGSKPVSQGDGCRACPDETTLYIDIIGPFQHRRFDDRVPPKPEGKKPSEDEKNNVGLEMVKETSTREKEVINSDAKPEESTTKVEEVKVEAEEPGVHTEEEGNEQSTADEVKVNLELGEEERKIRVPDSDADEDNDDRENPESPSVFSTCSEWLESLDSGRTMEARSLPTVFDDDRDSISAMAHPDRPDSPPPAPRGPGVNRLQGAAGPRSVHSLGDFSRTDRKAADACHRCTRGANAGIRPVAASRSVGPTSSTAQSNRRRQSVGFPTPPGPSPQRTGRAPPHTSNVPLAIPRRTPVPAGANHTSVRSVDHTPTKCNVQPHQRGKPAKPDKGKKPAWK